MNRIAALSLFLASSDALLVGVAPKCAPIRIFMEESEMEYRKRMADTRDASKSIEWNAALAALDKITPPMVLGRPVTPIDIPALQSAISDAMAAGVEYDEIAPFEKVLLDAVKASGEDIARDPALMKLQEESAARQAALDQVIIDADNKRQKAMMAFKAMNTAKPSVMFGKVNGKVDLPAYRAAIDAAIAAGVDEESIEENEKLYDQASGKTVPRKVDPRQGMYDAYYELQAATPTMIGGLRLPGPPTDVPRLKAAIEAAKEAGVDESAITMAEKALKAAGGA